MDGTLLKKRSIFVFGEIFGFTDDLWRIFKKDIEFYEKSMEIAKFFENMDYREILKIFREIPLNDHVDEVIKYLKKKDIKTAIATDSYQFLADDLRKRLGIDFAFANNIVIKDDLITGELMINNKDLIEDCINNRIYSINKSEILKHLCNVLNIKIEESIAVGDGMVDICMLKEAGLGVAYNASKEVQQHADICINDMKTLIDYI